MAKNFIVALFRLLSGQKMMWVLLCIFAQKGYAQFSEVWGVEEINVEQNANFHLVWKGRETIDGFFFEPPQGVSLLQARWVRMDQTLVSAELRWNGRAYQISTGQPLRGPVQLILTVRGERENRNDAWAVLPFRYNSSKTGRSLQSLDMWRTSRSLVISPKNAGLGRAKSLVFNQPSQRPLEIKRSALPSLHGISGFTISFWLRTTELNQVVMTTWNGRETLPYPLEIQINAMGKLVFYRGQSGMHQSLFTPRPIADGGWHHIAITNHPQQNKLFLALDGVFVDSLQNVSMLNTIANRLPLYIGKRPDEDPNTGFRGALQELSFWNRPRTEAALRSTLRQPFLGNSEGLVRIGFEQMPSPDLVSYWPSEVERLPSNLLLHFPIQDFTVTPRSEHVYLSWRIQSMDTKLFRIERSLDGHTFEEIGTVRPTELGGREGMQTFSFIDSILTGDVLYYRIRQYYTDASERYSGILKVGRGSLDEPLAELIGNSPNPFNPHTRISYQVRQSQFVEITVWSLTGVHVGTLVQQTQAPGIYYIDFNGSDLASGTYLVRMQTPNQTQTMKIVLAK